MLYQNLFFVELFYVNIGLNSEMCVCMLFYLTIGGIMESLN